MVSGSFSLFCSKCFSPFLHSTRSLSVSLSYLALPDGAGRFLLDSSCLAVLRIYTLLYRYILYTGLSPSLAYLSRYFYYISIQNLSYIPTTPCLLSTMVWAFPFSLATTQGITIVFFSSRYLDVSVPWVSSTMGH